MANKKLSALAAATALDGTERLYVVQGGVSKQTDVGDSLATLKALSGAQAANLATLAGVSSPLDAGLRDYLNVGPYATTRTAMAAMDLTKDLAVRLTEAGREGPFLANTGNLSSILVGPAVSGTATAATDTIASTAHGFGSGNAVVATVVVAGISTNTVMYVIVTDTDNYQLAASYADVLSGTPIDLTADGSVTVKLHYDPQQTIYVTPSADITGASGAYVRTHEGVIRVSWAGVPEDDGVTDAAPAMAGLIALCNRNSIFGVVEFADTLYRFGSRLPDWTRNQHFKGERGAFQRTIWQKDYVETNDNKGILTFINGGWLIEDITITAKAGSSGGAAIAQVTTGTTAGTANTGSHFMNRVHISCGNGVKKTIYLNGGTNVEAAGPGLRVVMLDNCEFFGAAEWTADFQSVQHVFATNCFFATSGGTASGGVLQVGGTASAPSDDYDFNCLIAGPISLDRLSRAKFDCLRIQGNITNTSNVTHTRIVGTYNSGTLQHNWDNDNCEYQLGVPYMDFAEVRLTASQSDVTGDGTKQAVIFNSVGGISTIGWDGTLVYNTGAANGRFTAKRSGPHRLNTAITLTGIAAGHTSADITIERFTSGGVLALTKTMRINPSGLAVSGRVTLPFVKTIVMSAGDYLVVSVTVSGSTKVVDIDGTDTFTSAEFGLAA